MISISVKPTNWISLALPDRPTGRANAAGCLIPNLDIFLIDGGTTERRIETDDEQSTFILDTKLHSTTSWRWVSDVRLGTIQAVDFWPKLSVAKQKFCTVVSI